MKKDWWFYKNGFMDWLSVEFVDADIGLDTQWTYNLVTNLIDYGLTVTETPKDFIDMMLNIVPEVTYDEWYEWIYK